MKKMLTIIAIGAVCALAQNTITADAGRTTKADSLRWGGTRDSTTKLMARGNTIYRDSSSTWVAITTDSCSLPVKIGQSALPNKKLEVSYEVRTSSGNTDSSQLKLRIDTRYCNGTLLSNACDSWVSAGRYKGDTATYVIDSLITVSTSSGTTWKPTRQLIDVPGGNQIRFCADGYRDGGASGDTTFFRYFIVRQSAVPSGGIPPGSGTGGAGDASASNQTSGAQKTQIVDGSGNVIASTSNNLNVQCANCSGSGASAADEASFTAGSSSFAPAGVFYQTTATNNALTTGQQGMVQGTAQRAAFVNPRNSSGTEIGTASAPIRTDPTGTTAQPITDNSGSITVDYATTGSGTATGALRVELPTNGTGVLATVGAVTTITNTVGVGGVAATDAAVSGNPVYVAGRASAAAPADVSADGDVVPAWRLRNGADAVQPTYAGVLQSTGNGVAGTGTPRVTIASDNTAFSVNAVQSGTWTVQPGNTANTTGWFVAGGSATDAAVTGNPLLQGGRASTATPTAMSADGDAVPQWLDRSGAQVVTGYVAHDAPVGGNPVLQGFEARTSDITAVANGDAVRAQATVDGKPVYMPYSVRATRWSYAAASGGIVNTTGVTIASAAGSGLRNCITAIDIENGHATVSTEVVVRDGASGTVLKRWWAQAAGGGISRPIPSPVCGTANTLLEVAAITTGSAIYVNAEGYTSQE